MKRSKLNIIVLGSSEALNGNLGDFGCASQFVPYRGLRKGPKTVISSIAECYFIFKNHHNICMLVNVLDIRKRGSEGQTMREAAERFTSDALRFVVGFFQGWHYACDPTEQLVQFFWIRLPRSLGFFLALGTLGHLRLKLNIFHAVVQIVRIRITGGARPSRMTKPT